MAETLDCKNGLQCNEYECECRHLDEIEQKARACSRHVNEAAFQYPETPNLIVTASRDMGRTASTWVFNAIRLLYRQAREACDSYWIRQLSQEKLRLRLQSGSGAHVLIKTHEFTDNNFDSALLEKFEKELVPMFTHVVVSVRKGFPQDAAWMKYATHVSHYEEIVKHKNNDGNSSKVGALQVLRNLADHIGISGSLSDDDIRVVDYQLMTLPIPGDQATKFWSFHSRRGGRPHPKKPKVSKTRNPQSEKDEEVHGICATDVLVTRHGARIDNGPDRDRTWLCKAGHGRQYDSHLSPLGHYAASELASELVCKKNNKTTEIKHIVSSPFIRCVETADAVAKAMCLSIKIEPGISEVGSTASHMASQEELAQSFPCIDEDYVPIMPRSELPHGEYSDGAAARRAATVGMAVRRKVPNGAILFVGHGASCLGLVRAFGSEGYVGYCSLSHFQWTGQQSSSDSGHDDRYDDKKGKWRLLGQLGDVSHLSDKSTALDSAW